MEDRTLMTRNGRVFRSKGGIYIETGEVAVYLGRADGWAAREYATAILELTESAKPIAITPVDANEATALADGDRCPTCNHLVFLRTWDQWTNSREIDRACTVPVCECTDNPHSR